MYYHEKIFIARDCIKIAEQKLDAGEKIEVNLINFDEFVNLCRKPNLTMATELRLILYEAILDKDKKDKLRKDIFG